MTASNLKTIVRCTKLNNAVQQILYPGPGATSEALIYGRVHKQHAVSAYTKAKFLNNVQVELATTGLHVHPDYPFLAVSPDQLVLENGVEGLLEVKCPFSKIGMTPEEACLGIDFCCELRDGAVCLKKNHSYFFQVQGQMAVTGHQWCDFVVWTNNTGCTKSTSV